MNSQQLHLHTATSASESAGRTPRDDPVRKRFLHRRTLTMNRDIEAAVEYRLGVPDGERGRTVSD